ncbi:MAG: hypothetical protein OEY26_11490 [Nitrospinota bacterium]|jgi:hypothetical protein|nr:hypothetical protein [Nitrospinota bacterium]
MKTTKMIQTLTAATASLFLFANIATAHSEHDHSLLSLNWKFSKKVEDKIQARGTLQDNGHYIGLSSHEQNTMKHYGIRFGNIFSTQVDGVDAYVKRTSTGIQVMDMGVSNVGMKEQLPIRNLNWISRISTGSANHSGHDHSMLPYEWSFGEATQNRIAQRLGSKEVVFVGLNRFEQNLLNDYHIKVGNQFHTVINGQTTMAERTSGGLKIMGLFNNEMAQMNSSQANM